MAAAVAGADALREVLSAAGGGVGNTPPPIVCPGHTRPLAEVAFSPHTPDGYFLISGCLDGSPMLRDASSGDWIGTFAGHKGAVWSAQLCSEARLAATGSGDFSAKVWDAVTGACLATLEHKHIVKSVDFRGDRACLATGGHEGLARVYDVERGLGARRSRVVLHQGRRRRRPPPAAINKVCWTPGGAPLLVCGAADGRVLARARARPSASPVATLECRSKAGVLENVMDLELTDGTLGPTLTVAAGDRVHLFDAADWGRVRRAPIDCPVHFREEGGASLRPDGRELVLGGAAATAARARAL
ncbi:serine-threonine kinase receptor-associated protein [Aureococcus anophagefferens]|uniref:Serine-threonine kinase receptor-associated protein n=1 Tax=Aureococcus anophagefferens TaxID=44056 RepID=A0ABR1FN19_AURAN